MATRRIRWAIGRVLSLKFFRRLNAQLANPAHFYWSVLLKLVPNLHNRPLTLEFRDGRVFFVRSFMTLFIFEEIFLTGVYDIDIQCVESILDIGANTGLFVLRAKERWPDAKIVAFEPEPGNYAALCETIKANEMKGVTAVQAAVAAEGGFVMLYRDPRNIGRHSIVFKQSGDSLKVPSRTISDALSLCPNGRCDLMKVDCEGAEDSIFRCLDAELAARIGTIIYEPSEGYSVTELNGCLEALGFKISTAKGNVIARWHAGGGRTDSRWPANKPAL